MEKCQIYILKNKINAKVYVGQTWKSFAQRANGGTGYQRSTHLNAAIKKYGWENFYYELLDFTYDQKSADELEEFYIIQYNSRNNGKKKSPKSIAKTAKGNLGNKSRTGQKNSTELREKISKALKGKMPKNIEMLNSTEIIKKRQQTFNAKYIFSDQKMLQVYQLINAGHFIYETAKIIDNDSEVVSRNLRAHGFNTKKMPKIIDIKKQQEKDFQFKSRSFLMKVKV